MHQTLIDMTSNVKRVWLRAAILFLTDLIALWIAWLSATWVAVHLGRASTPSGLLPTTRGETVYALIAILLTIAFAMKGQYTRRGAFWDETGVTWRYVTLAAMSSLALNFLVQTSNTRTVPLLAWLLVFLLLPVGRLINREWMIPAGYWRRKALVVGDGENARATAEALQGERHMGITVAAIVSFSGVRLVHPASETDEYGGIPAQLLSVDVEAMARQLECSVIVVTLDDEARGKASHLVRSLHAQQFEVFVVPALGGLPVHGMRTQQFFSNDILLLRLQHKLLNPLSRGLKRTVDLTVAIAALLGLAPLMAWVAWRIWREDGAPVIYSQPRVGEQGQDFSFFKFRSMVRNADSELEAWKTQNPALFKRYTANNFKLHDDPRVLKVGRLIRRTSIDELPQLWNVLRGDMSLVGPRPLLRRELPLYPADTMELYGQVKPGITGLWQVSGRSHTSFEKRAALDSWYVRNWSLWIDWVLLFKTVRVVLSGKGAV